MTDVIVLAVLAVLIAVIVRYLYKTKKRGVVCIGCPSGGCACCGQSHTGSESQSTCASGTCHCGK